MPHELVGRKRLQVDQVQLGDFFPDRRAGEIEDDWRERAEVGEDRMDWTERALSDAILDDQAERARHAGERGERLAIEVRAAFGDFAEHDGGEVRVLQNQGRQPGDYAVDFLARRAATGGDGPHA